MDHGGLPGWAKGSRCSGWAVAGTNGTVAVLSPAVYATMRDLAKGERLLQRLGGRCPDTLEVLQLDVTDPRSLEAAARRVQGQALDVLGTALPRGPRGGQQDPPQGRCQMMGGAGGPGAGMCSMRQGCGSWV